MTYVEKQSEKKSQQTRGLLPLRLPRWQRSNTDVEVLRLAAGDDSDIVFVRGEDVSAPLPGTAPAACVGWPCLCGFCACGLRVVFSLSLSRRRCLIVVPVVAPSDVGGGGGSSKELTITWTVRSGLSTGEEGESEREKEERSQSASQVEDSGMCSRCA